jgi:hypothetical protein
MGGLQMRKMNLSPLQKMSIDKNDQRNAIELLRSRAKLLKGNDKILMLMYLDKGNSFRQMACLAGVHERNIARRIYKLARLLIEGEYIYCLRNHKKFSTTELAVAKEYFLNGLSMEKIAAKRHFTLYHVRKILQDIRLKTQVCTVRSQGELRLKTYDAIYNKDSSKWEPNTHEKGCHYANIRGIEDTSVVNFKG